MKNRKWFTLLEVLLSVTIVSIFLGTILLIFKDIKSADWKMVDKRIIIAESSNLIDMIHDAALNYTIDYEEYFNRQMVWAEDTSYWNLWELYYCWGSNGTNPWKYKFYIRRNIWFWCPQLWNQKYLEYYFQHRKLSNANILNSATNSWAYQWKWPTAISPNIWLDYLYLINENWTERYYFRRVKKEEKDINNSISIDLPNEELYTIQMLKLQWLDAWVGHDFNSRWTYDWFIDTRVCDNSQWYYCNWNIVSNKNRLPIDWNDWWIDITSNKVTVSDMKIDIYPVKDPYLAINESEYRSDPYAKISFTMNMYWIESSEEITMTTSLSFKNSYSKFPTVKFTWYITTGRRDGSLRQRWQ